MKCWRFALALLGLSGGAAFGQAQQAYPVPVVYAHPPQIISTEVGPEYAPVVAEPSRSRPIRSALQRVGLWPAPQEEHPVPVPVPGEVPGEVIYPQTLIQAQGEYGTAGQIFYPHVQTAPPAVTPPTQVGPPSYVPPQYPYLEPEPGKFRPIRNCLQRLGVGCWSHHTYPTCGSLRAELTFIFGSCRAFFGEACQHGPPRMPGPQPFVPTVAAPLVPEPHPLPPGGPYPRTGDHP
jgi:hypothetical protein